MEKYTELKPDEILSEQDRSEYVLLDVRTDEEFHQGHIPYAKHIPVDQLELRLNELNEMKDRKILCICRSGYRSSLAAEFLFDQGFLQLFNLAGGLLEWTGPIES